MNLSTYLSSLAAFNILKPEEERRLVEQLRSGDKKAGEMLIKSNLRLVVYIAKQFTNSGLDLDDLIEEGNEGLTEAARDFVTKEGTNFKSYADDCIRHQIVDAIRGKAKPASSLDQELTDAFSLLDTIEDKHAINPESVSVAHESSVTVVKLLKTLTYKERAVMQRIANGYNPDEVDKEIFNSARRKLSHPSRLALID